MRDQRNTARESPELAGKAVLSGRTDAECSVGELAATGARLSFSHPIILPRQFTLRFAGEDHRVTVVWQAGVSAGVRFQSPTRAYVPEQKKRFASGVGADEAAVLSAADHLPLRGRRLLARPHA